MPFELQTLEMTAEQFRLLRDLIHEHCGIYYRDEFKFLMERRLSPRLQSHGLLDFGAYYRFLRYDVGRRAELEAAAETLTTNETYFYREPRQLRAFSEEILPILASEKARERTLRVWSAGCSSGEEAYTIAILIESSRLFEGWDVRVFGSDIARRVLAVAQGGAYGEHAFRSAEAQTVKRWFQPVDGKWLVDDGIRRLVHFGHLNLLDDAEVDLVGPADVVFCRNVMIYFDLAARRSVLRALHRRLKPGGFLLLGHSECLLHVTADFELVHLRNDLVYRKPSRKA